MKGFAQADRAEHKAKFQQEFMLCPEWAKVGGEIFAEENLAWTQDFKNLLRFV